MARQTVSFELAPSDPTVFTERLRNAHSPVSPEAEIGGVRVWIGDRPLATAARVSPETSKLISDSREVLRVSWGLNVTHTGRSQRLDRLVVEIRLETTEGACRVLENLPRQEFITEASLKWSGEVSLGYKDVAGAKLQFEPQASPTMTPHVVASSPMCSLSLWTFYSTPSHPLEGGVELVQFVEVPRGTSVLLGHVYVEGAAPGLLGAFAPFLEQKGSGAVRVKVPVVQGDQRGPSRRL